MRNSQFLGTWNLIPWWHHTVGGKRKKERKRVLVLFSSMATPLSQALRPLQWMCEMWMNVVNVFSRIPWLWHCKDNQYCIIVTESWCGRQTSHSSGQWAMCRFYGHTLFRKRGSQGHMLSGQQYRQYSGGVATLVLEKGHESYWCQDSSFYFLLILLQRRHGKQSWDTVKTET